MRAIRHLDVVSSLVHCTLYSESGSGYNFPPINEDIIAFFKCGCNSHVDFSLYCFGLEGPMNRQRVGNLDYLGGFDTIREVKLSFAVHKSNGKINL